MIRYLGWMLGMKALHDASALTTLLRKEGLKTLDIWYIEHVEFGKATSVARVIKTPVLSWAYIDFWASGLRLGLTSKWFNRGFPICYHLLQ